MLTLTRERLEADAKLVHRTLPPTPQICWPLLSARAGCEVWVKHENHLPVGAFKVRGGVLYMQRLIEEHPEIRGVIAATRGNHGQSVAFAAATAGLSVQIVVPHGNSPEKNAAMRALGGDLIEHGEDFQDALEYASVLAAERRLHFVPSFEEPHGRGGELHAGAICRGAGPRFGLCPDRSWLGDLRRHRHAGRVWTWD